MFVSSSISCNLKHSSSSLAFSNFNLLTCITQLSTSRKTMKSPLKMPLSQTQSPFVMTSTSSTSMLKQSYQSPTFSLPMGSFGGLSDFSQSRIALLEKHAKHIDDLKRYYESELIDLEGKVNGGENPVKLTTPRRVLNFDRVQVESLHNSPLSR